MGVKGLETIGMLVRTLIVIAVLAVVLDMLLPQNQFRTYLKMVMGLLVIVAVLQVVGQTLDEEWLADLPALALPLGSTEQGNKTIKEEGKRVSLSLIHIYQNLHKGYHFVHHFSASIHCHCKGSHSQGNQNQIGNHIGQLSGASLVKGCAQVLQNHTDNGQNHQFA